MADGKPEALERARVARALTVVLAICDLDAKQLAPPVARAAKRGD